MTSKLRLLKNAQFDKVNFTVEAPTLEETEYNATLDFFLGNIFMVNRKKKVVGLRQIIEVARKSDVGVVLSFANGTRYYIECSDSAMADDLATFCSKIASVHVKILQIPDWQPLPNEEKAQMTPSSADTGDEVSRKRARINSNSITTPKKPAGAYGGREQRPVRERAPQNRTLPLTPEKPAAPQNTSLQLATARPCATPQSSSSYRAFRSSLRFGLQNLGNTCYLNATMQALCSLKEFVNDLQAMPKKNPLVEDGKIFSSSSDILRQMMKANSSTGSTNPAKLRDSIAESAPMFAGSRQHDAHEFLLEYLNQLHDELLGANQLWQRIAADGNTVEVDIPSLPTLQFHSEITKQLECFECKATHDFVERFRDLSLDVPEHTHEASRAKCEVRAMLATYLKAEMVEAKCEHCGAVNAEMQKRLTTAPRLLVLHLKRYVPNFELQRFDKNFGNVKIPLQFDLNAHLLDEELNAGKPSGEMEPRTRIRPKPMDDYADGRIYELTSIIVHDGASPHSGHYVCYARSPENSWKLYDDSIVTEIPADQQPERELGHRAYILFYVARF